ncbi:MAG: AAA family ATPase [Candidatus Thiodiazotropha endolucinida]
MKLDPYANNILVQGLGQLLDDKEVMKRLLYLPEKPTNIHTLTITERRHHLMSLLDFHIPSKKSVHIYQSIDSLLRQSYRYRDPNRTSTWRTLNGEMIEQQMPRSPALATAIAGHAGTGKTESILRTFGCYPQQVIKHDNFPKLVGPHYQVSWLTVDIPDTGRSADLATNLMRAWDAAMAKYNPTYTPRFEQELAKSRRNGGQMLDEWRQVALSHFLGILHLDEIQNLFKLATLKQRRATYTPNNPPELSIVEDQSLRWILSLLNTWQIAVVVSGTPDGIGALTKRLSTTQRIITGGYHKIVTLTQPNSGEFKELFFEQLIHYQYVNKPINDSAEFRQLILDLTAGIPRVIIALWFAAHKVSFERGGNDLRFDDFEKASKTLLSPIRQAVTALNSGDPILMAQYEDLMPLDDAIWASIWGS